MKCVQRTAGEDDDGNVWKKSTGRHRRVRGKHIDISERRMETTGRKIRAERRYGEKREGKVAGQRQKVVTACKRKGLVFLAVKPSIIPAALSSWDHILLWSSE